MFNKKGWIWIVILQVLFLSLLSGSYYATDAFGKTVVLKTKPRDPRDVIYGDYVDLTFDISEAPVSQWPEKWKHQEKNVYVLLEEKKGIYQVHSLSFSPPAPHEHEVVLQAKAQPDWSRENEMIHLEYGFERYYVPEHTGTVLGNHTGSLYAVVKVAPWGQSRLVSLYP